MSSTTDIQNKWQAIYNGGLDLGLKKGAEQDAGFGGRYQDYGNARIYWHPGIGTFEVHGGILTKYLSMGGTGFNPATNNRDLGFPTSDESWVIGDNKRVSHFEWGAIYWAYGGQSVCGEIYTYYKQLGENESDLGFPVTGNIKLPGAEVAYFEFGCIYKPNNINAMPFSFNPPLIGCPTFLGTDRASTLNEILIINALIGETIAGDQYIKAHPDLLQSIFKGKLALREVTTTNLIYLDIDTTAVTYTTLPLPSDPHLTSPYIKLTSQTMLPNGTLLGNRKLYDLCFVLDNTHPPVPVSPHCYYAKNDWNNFQIMHITDTHVAKRYDWIRHELKKHSELQQAYPLFMNPNDNFRNMVTYANHLHDLGELDVIMHTGDLIDYIFENDDYKNGSGNYGFFIDLLLGKTKYADDAETPSQELKIPILTTLGNHDYRTTAYDPYIDIQPDSSGGLSAAIFAALSVILPIPGLAGAIAAAAIDGALDDHGPANSVMDWLIKKLGGEKFIQPQYQDWNLTQKEAIFLQLLWGRDRKTNQTLAASFITIDPKLHYYNKRVSGSDSFIVRLGKNRLAMISTGPDAVIPSKLYDLIAEYTKSRIGGNEADKRFFEGGDTVGFTDSNIKMIQDELNNLNASGAFIIGIHAPAINTTGGEYCHYFRETEHPTINPELMLGFVTKDNPELGLVEFERLKLNGILGLSNDMNGWMLSKTPYFMNGNFTDKLDNGSPFQNLEKFWELCLGINLQRKVDLVLSGHIHKRTEWRLSHDSQSNSMICYFDFYTDNPSQYYSSNHYKEGGGKQKVYINIKDGAKVNDQPVIITDSLADAVVKQYEELAIPSNPNTLNNSSNPSQWWDQHRPLITQTSCLGWTDNMQRQDPDVSAWNGFRPEPLLTGLRLIQINNNVITKMQYINHGMIEQLTNRVVPSIDPLPAAKV